MSLTDERRVQFEHNWANHAAKQSLPRSLRNLWHTFQYTARTFVFERKQHVVWKLTDEGVEVVDVLRLVSASMDLKNGIVVTLQSRNCGELKVTSTPSLFEGLDVFFWVPAINEVRYTPHDWNNAGDVRDLRVAVNFKQMRSLEGGPVFDTHYLTELRDFKRLDPNAVI